MKLENQPKDKIEIIAEQKKTLNFLGTMRPKKGHTLFEINHKDNTIVKATFETKEVAITGNKYKKVLKVITKENCSYISALNKKNVIKIIKKQLPFFVEAT